MPPAYEETPPVGRIEPFGWHLGCPTRKKQSFSEIHYFFQAGSSFCSKPQQIGPTSSLDIYALEELLEVI